MFEVIDYLGIAVLLVLAPIFFISKKFFFASCLIARSYANLTVGREVFGFPLNDALAILTLLGGGIYLLSNIVPLLSNTKFKSIFLTLLTFLVFTWLAAVSSGFDKMIEAAKISSWLIFIPVGFILFSDEKGLSLLKNVGFIAAIIIFSGFVIGQVKGLGETAYGFGAIHLGFFSSEAALVSSLIAVIVLLAIPVEANKNRLDYSKIITLVFLGVIVSVLVRSAILAIFMFFTVYIIWRDRGAVAKKLFFLSGFFAIFCAILIGIFISNPQHIETRFKDVRNYQSSGNVDNLGSGRISLIKHYYDEFRSQSLWSQLMGVDLGRRSKNMVSSTYQETKYGTHNDILQLMFLSGVIGLIFYLLMWLLLVLTLYKALIQSRNGPVRKYSSLGFAVSAMYGVLVFHGTIFHVFLMQVVSVVVSACIGYYVRARIEASRNSSRIVKT